MKMKFLTLCILLVCMSLCTACGFGSPTTTGGPQGSGNTPTQTSAEPTSMAAPTVEESDTGSDEETLSLKNIDEGLGSLESYRMRFTLSFEGKNDEGKEESGSVEMIQEFIKATKDQHIRWTALNSSQDITDNSAEIFQVGGVTYIYSPDRSADQKCVSMSGDNASAPSELFRPENLIGGIEQAKLVGKGETVNGIVSDRYTFDESGATFATFANAEGEAWIAQEGGFLVKYTGKATGKVGLLSDVAEGTMNWEYNIEEVNQIEAIALPQECEGQKPADDIPLPDNATDKGNFAGTIVFKSPDSPADVAAFFKQELPANGWESGEESELAEMQMLSFTKDGRTLSITITKEESGGSSVLMNEQKGP